jgi:LacI family transcriptional regulator, gluconate utilization system Gnt-I transcriptional repressor
MTEVARRAGVSVMTVSRVFSEPDSVAADTRQRIEQVATDIGYVPDGIAAALKRRASHVVAAIVPSLTNNLYTAMLHGLSAELSRQGFVLSVAEAAYSPAEEARVVRELLRQRPAALVLHETAHEAGMLRLIEQAGVVVVETGDLVDRPIDTVVSFSNRDAAAALTRHLLERGRRNIAFVTLPLARSSRARQRLEGFRSALAAAGATPGADAVFETAGGYAETAVLMDRILASKPAFDAVLGAGDVLAVGLAIEAAKRGLAVPGQLAIASFDDHEIGRVLDPPLTGLELPREAIGRRAAEIIIARLRGSAGERRVDLSFALTVRAST